MASSDKQSILLVEDDLDLAEMLNAYFNVQGYSIRTIPWGEKAVELAAQLQPDLIILDIHLPDIDGFEVRTRLRESHKTRSIPVIFLTERTDRVDRLQGLEMGVIDYITKPFDIQELRLRVRNVLRRAATLSLDHPVTGLPEGDTVDDVLRELVEHPSMGLLVAALRGLDDFRELYSFVASDDVLRVTSLTIVEATREVGGPHAFYGHLDDHTFIVLVPHTALGALETLIRERIGESLEYFYPGDNRGPNARTSDRLRLLLNPISEIEGEIGSVQTFREQLLRIHEALIHNSET